LKIVVTAGGIIWNESHPALQKYGSDVVIVRRSPDAAAELVARVGADRNVLVLTDNDPRSFMPLQVLTRQFQSRRIHLFVCLPFAYESTRRKQEILELLQDFSVVKTVCVVELDTFLNETKKDETLGGLQLRIRNGMIDLIDRAASAMKGLDEFCRYRYDLTADVYREDDFSTLGDEFAEKLLTKRKTSPVRDKEENAADRPEELPAAETPASEVPAAEEPEEKPVPKKRRSLFAFLKGRKA